MRTIAVANQKGGCGKTTTTINLAACLSRQRKNVLVIDLDPQGHATLGLNIKPQDVAKSMYDVLSPVQEVRLRLDEVIIPVCANFDLAPANLLLSAIEQELAGMPEREAKLAQAISLMVSATSYDFILIDCPPSLGLLTFNALRAAQELIAPIDTGFFAMHGIGKLLEIVELLRSHSGSSIQVRALLTMYDGRTKFAQELRQEITRYFGGNVFQSMIRHTVRLKEASSFGLPIIAFDKRSGAAGDYSALARELTGKSVSGVTGIPAADSADVYGPHRVNGKVLFSVRAPEAHSVLVAGDFNNWIADQRSALESAGNGVWRRALPLQPGTYRYKFVVDGQWVPDPHNTLVEQDAGGNVNSVLEC